MLITTSYSFRGYVTVMIHCLISITTVCSCVYSVKKKGFSHVSSMGFPNNEVVYERALTLVHTLWAFKRTLLQGLDNGSFSIPQMTQSVQRGTLWLT